MDAEQKARFLVHLLQLPPHTQSKKYIKKYITVQSEGDCSQFVQVIVSGATQRPVERFTWKDTFTQFWDFELAPGLVKGSGHGAISPAPSTPTHTRARACRGHEGTPGSLGNLSPALPLSLALTPRGEIFL